MNVIRLPVITRLDLDPEVVLEAAQGQLKSVVILGYDEAGKEYFASSIADGGTVLWLMAKCKRALLDVEL